MKSLLIGISEYITNDNGVKAYEGHILKFKTSIHYVLVLKIAKIEDNKVYFESVKYPNNKGRGHVNTLSVRTDWEIIDI